MDLKKGILGGLLVAVDFLVGSVYGEIFQKLNGNKKFDLDLT